MAYRKWKPSKTAKREFAQKMNEIDEFCKEHGIHQSSSSDSYYFTLNGKDYRVSNHSVEASNARASTDLGEKIREKYHPNGREEDVIYIHASKTRIKEIYNNLVAGYELDGRGNIKESQTTEPIKKLEDLSTRENRAVTNLIATHEELLQVPTDERITNYYGDYGIHTFKYGTTETEFRPAYQNALNALGTTSEEFESYLSTERYKNRYNVIADLQSKLLKSEQAQNIKPICKFDVQIDNESVFKSYSYLDALKNTLQEKTNPQNFGKKVEIVTAFADTGAVLNREDWGVVQPLQKHNKVKVHIYDSTRPPETPKEIITKHYGEIFEVKEQNGKLGIDWNTERSPYTCKGEVFTPFETFASKVVFEDINTGKTYSYSNITNALEETKSSIQPERKYELTDIRQSVSISGETLYRIKALRDFTNEATGVEIKAGQLGGYVQSENNLSHSGTCWVDESARVFNDARVTDDAYIAGESMANKNTVIKDSAIVTGAAWITQSAKISGNAYIRDMAFIKGEAEIGGTAEVTGHHTIGGDTVLTSGIHNGTAAPTVTPAHSPTMEM